MTHARDEDFARRAREALSERDVREAWRRSGEATPPGGLELLASEMGTGSVRRQRILVAVAAAVLIALLATFALLRDSATNRVSSEARQLLEARIEDHAAWRDLADRLPDTPRSVGLAEVDLLEPRGGVTDPSPRFVVEVRADDTVELVLSVRVGVLTSRTSHRVEPGRSELEAEFERPPPLGVAGAWTIELEGLRHPRTPAPFSIVAEDEVRAARAVAAGTNPEDVLVRAAELLVRGLATAALDELDALPSTSSRETVSRARYLRAEARVQRGEIVEFEALRAAALGSDRAEAE